MLFCVNTFSPSMQSLWCQMQHWTKSEDSHQTEASPVWGVIWGDSWQKQQNHDDCNECKFKSLNEKHLKIHTERHHNEMACNQCDFKTKSRSKLMEHITRRNRRVRNITCKYWLEGNSIDPSLKQKLVVFFTSMSLQTWWKWFMKVWYNSSY